LPVVSDDGKSNIKWIFSNKNKAFIIMDNTLDEHSHEAEARNAFGNEDLFTYSLGGFIHSIDNLKRIRKLNLRSGGFQPSNSAIRTCEFLNNLSSLLPTAKIIIQKNDYVSVKNENNIIAVHNNDDTIYIDYPIIIDKSTPSLSRRLSYGKQLSTKVFNTIFCTYQVNTCEGYRKYRTSNSNVYENSNVLEKVTMNAPNIFRYGDC